ncbi:DUF423 domain-containing protein [Gottfriedia acidiceleris]|uniref:DUF423 domain-containing protein n=1 Tax=Gottfriedia acidiceleris TaxID=371036 RepID=UPI003D19791B
MKLFFLLGSIFAFLSIALGAFGAHGLEGKISERSLEIWQKAVQYQMFQTGGLFIIAFLIDKFGSTTQLMWAGWLSVIGIILFSGSLYILSVSGIKILGAITPLGGLAFLVAWILVGISVMK